VQHNTTTEREKKKKEKMPEKPPSRNDVSLEEVLRQDRGDCLPCRVIGSHPVPTASPPPLPCAHPASPGSAAFVGLGGYTYISGMSQLAAKEAAIARANTRFGIGIRRLGIQGTALGLFGLGLYRFFFT